MSSRSLDAGQAGRGVPDEAVLAYAHLLGRAVLTLNRKHFRNLHDAGQIHGGLILCTQDSDFEAPAVRIDSALKDAGALSDQLLKINRPPA